MEELHRLGVRQKEEQRFRKCRHFFGEIISVLILDIYIQVVLFEGARVGGTCVNVGCVPKKVMFNAADMAEMLHDAQGYGFDVQGGSNLNWSLLKEKRDAYILRLNGIYERNLSNSGLIFSFYPNPSPCSFFIFVVKSQGLPLFVNSLDLSGLSDDSIFEMAVY